MTAKPRCVLFVAAAILCYAGVVGSLVMWSETISLSMDSDRKKARLAREHEFYFKTFIGSLAGSLVFSIAAVKSRPKGAQK